MRRYLILLFVIFLACRAGSPTRPTTNPTVLHTVVSPMFSATPFPTATPATPSSTPRPTSSPPSPSPTPSQVPPTFTLTATVSPLPAATVTQTPAPQPVQVTVLFHPDGGLYVGDQVSIEVIVPHPAEASNPANQVEVKGPDGNLLGTAGFAKYGLGQRDQAMMVWAWDTHGLQAGEYPLTFTLEPGGNVWTETVSLLLQSALPWPEPQAHWAEARSKCCTLYYITGTAAERDLADLLRQADELSRDAVQRMGIDFTAPITVTLLSRVLGHGGFAGDGIDISYLDRNYAGSDFGLVLHHEMIHILDGRLGGGYRPSLFVEGLAVYKSGGHFKPEPLMPRAAALLPTETGLGWYIPLAELADNFYLSQHEIGYLEGASLIEYMVNTWGWEAFSSFYRDIRAADDNKPSSAIDAALQKHFQMRFTELEAKFKQALGRIPVTTALRDDMRLTVEFFDTVRRYQQLFDPSAFFQTAWLVDAPSARQRGIVADYLRHTASAENLALEIMLSNAFTSLSQGQYASGGQVLAAINAVLEAYQRGYSQPFEVNEQAADYYAIVQAASQSGYEAQKIEVDGNTAQIWATAGSAELVELSAQRGEAGWVIGVSLAGFGFDPGDWAVSHSTGEAGVAEFKNGDSRWVIPLRIPILAEWGF